MSLDTTTTINNINDQDHKPMSLDDDVVKQTTIKLVSKDGVEKTVEVKHALISDLVKTSLGGDDTATEVPLPSVDSSILEEIVKYMNEHKGTEEPIVEMPLRSKVMKDVCKSAWDAEFIDRIGEERKRLFDLFLASNYMAIKGLMHLCAAKTASLAKGQPLEKIKEIFSLEEKKSN